MAVFRKWYTLNLEVLLASIAAGNTINNMLAMPEIKSTYESLGLANEYAQALDGLKDIEEAGNANIALNFLGYDCFLGFFGSIFTSYFASATIKLKEPQTQSR